METEGIFYAKNDDKAVCIGRLDVKLLTTNPNTISKVNLRVFVMV